MHVRLVGVDENNLVPIPQNIIKIITILLNLGNCATESLIRSYSDPSYERQSIACTLYSCPLLIFTSRKVLLGITVLQKEVTLP